MTARAEAAMPPVAGALVRAVRDLGRSEILRHALWPPLAALALWSGVAVLAWMPLSEWLLARLPEWRWLDWLGAWLVHGALFLVFAPLIYLTALLLVAVVAVPRMMTLVAARDYPDVIRHGSPAAALWGSLGNTLAAGLLFLLGWLVTLPLLLVPGVLLVLPLLWTAWLNQRTFRYDALAEHANALERDQLFRRQRRGFWAAGLVAALAAHVPVLNLLAPAFAGLVFIHLCLASLRALRQEEGVWVSAQ